MWRNCPMRPDVPRDARALLGWTRAAVSIPSHSRIAAPPCSSPPPFPSLFLATAAIVIEAYLIFLLFDCAGYILTFSLASSSQNISQFALILHDFMSNEEKKYLYKLTAKSIVWATQRRLTLPTPSTFSLRRASILPETSGSFCTTPSSSPAWQPWQRCFHRRSLVMCRLKNKVHPDARRA